MKLLYIYVVLFVFVFSGSAWSSSPPVNRAPIIVHAAKATPNPVNGSTVTLSVLADDDDGENKLVYTWKVLSMPAGSMVTFSVNGSNAAKNTTAILHKAGHYSGHYSFSVTARDAAGLSVQSSLLVIVNFP